MKPAEEDLVNEAVNLLEAAYGAWQQFGPKERRVELTHIGPPPAMLEPGE